MSEKATRELEKMQLKEKADEKYKEWLEKKRAEEAEKKKKEKVLNELIIYLDGVTSSEMYCRFRFDVFKSYMDIKWQCCTWRNLFEELQC